MLFHQQASPARTGIRSIASAVTVSCIPFPVSAFWMKSWAGEGLCYREAEPLPSESGLPFIGPSPAMRSCSSSDAATESGAVRPHGYSSGLQAVPHRSEKTEPRDGGQRFRPVVWRSRTDSTDEIIPPSENAYGTGLRTGITGVDPTFPLTYKTPLSYAPSAKYPLDSI